MDIQIGKRPDQQAGSQTELDKAAGQVGIEVLNSRFDRAYANYQQQAAHPVIGHAMRALAEEVERQQHAIDRTQGAEEKQELA